ncbi:hypothetical protein A2Z33_07010 [Candidatus Gottesmanbacteria bacterium RBG_16_52_11]|uniref:Dephospho-CoA kinase n=1 Tax=Candidatus Gottesmanbacteria bacterium RBG_16_52_11 TaxID=1798374 RepID=A0A1F5YYR0_9BACT|nr:MAG: hypothetical protein A2Z33_07010 [Candidatus Gottesmanbacteria bacterium RBG_16_52_11]
MKLLAIVGMPGSGKSVTAEFFRSKGLPVLRFGDQVDIGLAEHGLEKNEKNERWYREKLRQDLGMEAMAVKIEPRIRDAARKSRVIILDGLYSWEEYIYLSSRFPGLVLLCIWAPPKTRYSRLANRKVRPLTPETARSRDVAEIEYLNKGGPIAICDHLIVNDSGSSELTLRLENFYRTFLKHD